MMEIKFWIYLFVLFAGLIFNAKGFNNILSCKPNTCRAGKCVTQSGQNFCQCSPGYVGSLCQFVDPCSQSQCQNGGTCTTVVSTDDSQPPLFNCSCPLGYQASLCEISIKNACDNSPCKNHGTCQLITLDHFNCICPNGFKGETCDVVDHCALKPCANGGTCLEKAGNFVCQCPEGFSGSTCVEDVDECASVKPCVKGRCINVHGSYRCECEKGYSGKNCDQIYHPCNPTPCNNGGQCVLINPSSYRCQCLTGFTGLNCEVNADDCEGHKCLNGGSCVDGVRNYTCDCPSTYWGPYCADDVDECVAQSNVCQNGGTCVNTKGGFFCVCVNGWEGQFCQINRDDCDGTKCYNGGTCQDRVASFHCECPSGYTGLLCHLRDACMSSPCQGNAVCDHNPVDGSYVCSCPKGLFGVDCSEDVDECKEGNPCEHGGACVNTVGSYECRCAKGWKGSFCDEPINECLSSPCRNDATCLDDVGKFICVCMPGFTGVFCEIDIDDCASKPCLNNGVCRDHVNNYTCACHRGFTGSRCEKNIDDCSSKPCSNGGVCKDLINNFTCICPKGFSGSFCERNVNDCAHKPCVNGFCKDLTDNFTCVCDRGFAGTFCEVNVDECAKNPCLNGGLCHDLIDNYICQCPSGYSGHNCENTKEDRPFLPTLVNTVQPTTVDIHKFDGIDKMDKDNCFSNKCSMKANNGICDSECNFPACGFDGTDCSAGLNPFSLCKPKEYCVHVFKDGKCDSICNVETCLFDGFDCLDKTDLTCNPLYSSYCLKHMGDGTCDSGCNTRGCNYDGGDCNGDKNKRSVLVGAVALVLTVPPDVFLNQSKQFLMSLGNILDVNLEIKLDDKNRSMVYRWNSRDGVDSSDPLPISRTKRQTPDQILYGVFVVLVIDVTKCNLDGRTDCFSKIESVANFMATPKVTEALKQTLGRDWGIYSATPEVAQTESSSNNSVLVGSVIAIIAVLLLVVLVLTRKRKIIAHIWHPGANSDKNNGSFNRASNCRVSLDKNFSGAIPNVYESDPKRLRRDEPETPEQYERSRNGKFGSQIPYQAYLNDIAGYRRDCDQYSESETYSTYTDNSESTTAIPMSVPSKTLRLPTTDASGYFPTNHALNAWNEEHRNAALGIFNPLAVPSFVKSKGPDGKTPLMIAACNSCDNDETVKIVQKYVQVGADLNEQTETDGETALIMGVRYCRIQAVKIMLQMGADPNVIDHKGNNALHHAVNVNNVDLVSIILKDGKPKIDLEAKNDDGCTPLILAAKAAPGNAAILKQLLDSNASVSAQDNDGRTALHWAALQNDVEAMHCLLDKGANKDSTNQHDQTPLFFAVKEGHVEATRLLLKRGASRDLADNMDRTPLQVAEDNGFKEVADALTDLRLDLAEMYSNGGGCGTLPHFSVGRAKPKPPKRTKSLKEAKFNNVDARVKISSSVRRVKQPSLSESSPSAASSSSPSSGVPSVGGLSSVGGSPPLSVESAGHHCRSAATTTNSDSRCCSQKDVLSPSFQTGIIFNGDRNGGETYTYPAFPATYFGGGCGGAVYNQSPPVATDCLGSPSAYTDLHHSAAYSRQQQIPYESSPNYPTSASGFSPDIYFQESSPPSLPISDFPIELPSQIYNGQQHFVSGSAATCIVGRNPLHHQQQASVVHSAPRQQQQRPNYQKSSNGGYTHYTTPNNGGGAYDYVEYPSNIDGPQCFMSTAKNV